MGIQVAKQLAEISAIAVYAFGVSCILLLPFKYIPFLSLRVSEEGELNGLDRDQFLDEQIGDYSFFEEHMTHGIAMGRREEASSSGHSIDKEPTNGEKSV